VTDQLLVDVADGIATVTFNNPSKRNALSLEMRTALPGVLQQLQDDPAVRVVVITGAGDQAFVSGADISEFGGPEEARRVGRHFLGTLDAWATIPRVTIAAVNGFALGGGCELALACDFIYASENARFGLPEVSLGILPGFGGTQRLTRLLGRARAKELIFTGDVIDAAKAKEIGLVLDVVPLSNLLAHARAALERIAKKGPLAVRRAKEAIDRGADLELADGLTIERQVFSDLFDSDDRREGMKAFLEKRPPVFTGR